LEKKKAEEELQKVMEERKRLSVRGERENYTAPKVD